MEEHSVHQTEHMTTIEAHGVSQQVPSSARSTPELQKGFSHVTAPHSQPPSWGFFSILIEQLKDSKRKNQDSGLNFFHGTSDVFVSS